MEEYHYDPKSADKLHSNSSEVEEMVEHADIDHEFAEELAESQESQESRESQEPQESPASDESSEQAPTFESQNQDDHTC